MQQEKKFGKAIHWNSELNQLTVQLEGSEEKVIIEQNELNLSYVKNLGAYASSLFKLERLPFYLLPSNNDDDSSMRKASLREAILEIYQSISVGDIIEVTVSATTKHAIFANYKDILTIYISSYEISDSFIQDAGNLYHAGDVIKVQVISKSDDKYFVDASVKALCFDNLSNYRRGDVVKCRIANLLSDRTYYVEISPRVSGLIDWPLEEELPELDDFVTMIVSRVKEKGLKLNLV